MIAAQGYYEYLDGNIGDVNLNGMANLDIDYRQTLDNLHKIDILDNKYKYKADNICLKYSKENYYGF